MTRDETLRLMQRHADAWNAHDADALLNMMTDDCVYDGSAGPGPQGARFRARAFCQTRFPGGFRGPELREAAMLLQPEPAGAEVALEVGSTCRICPRADCPARREPSILRG